MVDGVLEVIIFGLKVYHRTCISEPKPKIRCVLSKEITINSSPFLLLFLLSINYLPIYILFFVRLCNLKIKILVFLLGRYSFW